MWGPSEGAKGEGGTDWDHGLCSGVEYLLRVSVSRQPRHLSGIPGGGPAAREGR